MTTLLECLDNEKIQITVQKDLIQFLFEYIKLLYDPLIPVGD
ncbi:MAG: hypothetical protein ACI8Q1_001358 [Parvicella sp.]|jgi:hypothetical protein